MNSAIPQSAISRPRPTTIRWSAVFSISDIRWLETNTTRPSAASDRIRLRIHKMPSGSSPFTGSSNISTCGSPSSAAAMPSRWLMPSENPLDRFPATLGQPHDVQHLAHPPRRDAVGLRQAEQVVPRTAAPVGRPRVNQRADLPHRAGRLAVRPPVDRDRPRGRPVQAQDQPHRGGLARPVRAQETGHQARPDDEAEIVDRERPLVSLGQSASLNHRTYSLFSVITPRQSRYGQRPPHRQPAVTQLHLGGIPYPI